MHTICYNYVHRQYPFFTLIVKRDRDEIMLLNICANSRQRVIFWSSSAGR